MITSNSHAILDTGGAWPTVSVIVPLFNYETYIEEALRSVFSQTIEQLGLVVVDDASSDASLDKTVKWCSHHQERFSHIVVLQNATNSKLSITRNNAISACHSPLIFPLDADNSIYPRCLERLSEAVTTTGVTFAYPMLETFGGERGIIGTEALSRSRMAKGNYIDAMALIRRDALIELGGYADLKYGWEDYDLWLRVMEWGGTGVQVPEILGRYRVHRSSMLRTVTNVSRNIVSLKRTMKQRHPWLELS